MLYVCIFLAAYVLGSIPFGLIIAKVGYKRDLRKYGSGNIGTTNAMRTLGHVGGALTFFLDTIKGYLGGLCALILVAVFGQLEVGPFVWQSLIQPIAPAANAVYVGVALLGGVVGHVFPAWLKFKGGKGVAVAGGCLFVLFGWLGGAVELVIFAGVVIASKYVSLGSLCAAGACPIICVILYWSRPVAVLCALAACALVFWAHRENIGRLRTGTERRVGGTRGGTRGT